MSGDPYFTVESKWCPKPIALRDDQWRHITKRHPEMKPYMEQVRLTLEAPWAVYETGDTKPTRAFYARDLITDDARFRESYVAVFVRYKMTPAYVWTAYLPTHLSNNPGTLLHLER